MSFDDTTIKFYGQHAAAYAERPMAPLTRLQRFLQGVPPRGAILELGCGAGRHSAEMIAAGFDVRPTDGSQEMAAEAARRLGRPVETLLFSQLDDDRRYEAVWASACLLHVPRPDLQSVLMRIWRALKADGLFYASFKEGETDGRDTLGRYYNYPSEVWLRQCYEAAGRWRILSLDRSRSQGYDNRPATMMHLVVRKTAI
jgi:SAM-dependent methyltransferase